MYIRMVEVYKKSLGVPKKMFMNFLDLFYREQKKEGFQTFLFYYLFSLNVLIALSSTILLPTKLLNLDSLRISREGVPS